MVIGIDIDDTFVQTNKRALEIIENEKIDEKVEYYEQLSDLSDFIHKYFKEIVYTAEIFDGAKEAIELIRNQGNKIVFVSSRAFQSGADTEEDTIEYLRRNKIKYDAIYLKKTEKLGVCMQEKIDVFIDDKEKILKPLSDNGIRCIKMTSHEKETSQFETVNNWEQIVDLLVEKI